MKLELKKLVATMGAIALLGGMAACGSTDSSASAGSSSSSSVASKPVEKPAVLTGSWKQVNAKSEDSWMEATITDSTIVVELVSDDTRSLYWAGSFKAPTEPGDYSWTSDADKEKLDSAILGSSDDTKEFTYSASSQELSWQTTMMGVSMTVKAKKV